MEGAGLSPWTYQMGEEQVGVKTAITDAGRFVLVIAGFENTEPARTLVQELSAAGVPNVSVHKGTVSGSDYYRVVQGPHQSNDESARQELVDRDFEDAWWLTSDMAPMQKTVKIAAQEPIKKSPPKQKPVTEQPMELKTVKIAPEKPMIQKRKVQIKAPRPGESYFDYCIQKANQLERAVYCTDGSFNDVAIAERGIVDRDAALLKFCALRATEAERQKYCTD